MHKLFTNRFLFVVERELGLSSRLEVLSEGRAQLALDLGNLGKSVAYSNTLQRHDAKTGGSNDSLPNSRVRQYCQGA